MVIYRSVEKMNEARKKEIRKIADHYGLEAQMNVAIEELAELTQAIARYRRYTGCDQERKRHLIACMEEEIADTEVMIAQMQYLLKAEQRVERDIDYKIDRLLRRMEEEGVLSK